MNGSKTVVRLGIDIGKNSFPLWGVNEQDEGVLKKPVRRSGLLREVAKLPACRIGMEACGGAHQWARAFSQHGHEVRFVPVKTITQQDVQALHRIRQAAVKARTAVVNQIRGLLGEYGMVIPPGVNQVRRALPDILEANESPLSDFLRPLIAQRYEQRREYEARIQGYERQFDAVCAQEEACQRLLAVAGIGPLVATALVGAFGDGKQFPSARQFAAALGLVPGQYGTGGKVRLLGISKRGDPYLRALLVHGARAAVNAVLKYNKTDARSRWVRRIVQERGYNRAVVAWANKNARIAWALLTRQDTYQVAT